MTFPTVVGFSGASITQNGSTSHYDLPIPTGSVGDLLVITVAHGRNVLSFAWPAGWTVLASQTDGVFASGQYETVYRVATGAEGTSVRVDYGTPGADPTVYHAYRIAGYQGVPVANGSFGPNVSNPDPAALTSGFGNVDTLWIAGCVWTNGSLDATGYPSGYTDGTRDRYNNTAGGAIATARTTSSVGTEDPGAFTISGVTIEATFVIAVQGADDLVADFSAAPTSGAIPLTVTFMDVSHGGTGTINSWSWTFGDGGTSSSQNPTHIYTTEGTYTVTLTVGNTTSQTDSTTAEIAAGSLYIPPPPSNAVIEIRAAAVGASRWGVAVWGPPSVWSSAGWVDVTPQSVDAVVRWGSHSPEAGILTETEPASWIVDTYDPDRLLDPGNADGPYHADLRAGLPIRIRHRGTIVRQGIAEQILFQHKDHVGGIRVTDNVSLMARSPVPSDTMLSDTLRARARDVIAAAGLSVTVEPDPPSGDPALAPRLDGDRSVWRHVADAAQQVLHVPYLDNVGTLHFRAWASPYDRARGVDSTELVDLGTLVSTSGLYSVINVQQTVGDGDALLQRRLTPTPRYGSVTYSRTDATPDADDWAAAVLADRSLQTVQWIPGAIYPLTADDVEYFATLESMERFGVDFIEAAPPVDITGIIVGGTFRVVSKKESEAVWSFEVELAQTADSPLYTDTDPPEFLLNEQGDGYLYPD